MNAALKKAHQERMDRLARMGALPPRPIIVLPPKQVAVLEETATREPLPAALDGIRRKARLMTADIAEAHGVTFRDVIGRARFKAIVAARMEACFEIAKQIPEMSLSEIGRIIRKDHTTVINAIRIINEKRGENLRNLGVVSAERKLARLRSARASIGMEARA